MDHKQASLEKQHNKQVEQASERPSMAPSVDIYENESEYLVIADVPGVRTDDIHIRYENGTLSLQAPREPQKLKTAITAEFGSADYLRVFSLPEDVDANKINAKLINGVLNLQLPKLSQAKPRQISVTAG